MQPDDSRTRRLMACLGDPSRFKVVTVLCSGERCVSEIAASVGLSQPCTTRHLQLLEREGLVRGERQGKRVLFRLRLEEPAVRGLIEWAVERDAGRVPTGSAVSVRAPAVGRAGAPAGGAVLQPRETMRLGIENAHRSSAEDLEDFLL